MDPKLAQAVLDAVNNLPDEQKLEGMTQVTVALHEFSAKNILPQVIQKPGRTDLERVTCVTYGRIHMQMGSLSVLRAPVHFQAAMMLSRSIFELSMDLFVLQKPGMEPRYSAHPDVARFDSARKLKNYLDRDPTIDQKPYATQIAFAADAAREARINAVKKTHWNLDPKDWPKGWYDKSIDQHAKDAGPDFELLYRELYPMMNWYAHGGGAGIASLKPETFLRIHGIAHTRSQKLFEKSIRLMNDLFKLTNQKELDEALKADAYLLYERMFDNK